MDNHTKRPAGPAALRMQAVARIAGREGGLPQAVDPLSGLRALYELASSPATAARALALLHELQVHQVELELQDEELRRSRAEVEGAFLRQQQVFDHLPVACLVIDRRTSVAAANLAAAQLFGLGREALIDRRLDSLLAADSAQRLVASLAVPDRKFRCAPLQLARATADGTPVRVTPRMSRDPDGAHFLLALQEG